MFYLFTKTEMERESFIWYSSFSNAIKALPDEDQLKLFRYITDYWIYGIEPEDWKTVANALFCLVKPQIDANNKRYKDWKKWWRPKKDWDYSKKPKSNQNKTKEEPKTNQIETEPEAEDWDFHIMDFIAGKNE